MAHSGLLGHIDYRKPITISVAALSLRSLAAIIVKQYELPALNKTDKYVSYETTI